MHTTHNEKYHPHVHVIMYYYLLRSKLQFHLKSGIHLPNLYIQIIEQ